MALRPSRAIALALAVVLAACGPGQAGDASSAAADTLTRRQKDSILSTMPVPGARSIGTALEAADAAAERARRLDSLGGNH